jgi:hypothetical protein
MGKHKVKRVVDKERRAKIKEERAKLTGFLQTLLATPKIEDKMAMVTQANPYFYLLTPRGHHEQNIQTNL